MSNKKGKERSRIWFLKRKTEKKRMWVFDVLAGLLTLVAIGVYLIYYTAVGDAVDVYKYLRETGNSLGDYKMSLVKDETSEEANKNRVMVIFDKTPQLEYFYAVEDNEVILKNIYDYENKKFINAEASVDESTSTVESNEYAEENVDVNDVDVNGEGNVEIETDSHDEAPEMEHSEEDNVSVQE